MGPPWSPRSPRSPMVPHGPLWSPRAPPPRPSCTPKNGVCPPIFLAGDALKVGAGGRSCGSAHSQQNRSWPRHLVVSNMPVTRPLRPLHDRYPGSRLVRPHGPPGPPGPPWSPMVPYGPPWSPMVPHGPPWSPVPLPVVLNRPSRPQPHQLLRRDTKHHPSSELVCVSLVHSACCSQGQRRLEVDA